MKSAPTLFRSAQVTITPSSNTLFRIGRFPGIFVSPRLQDLLNPHHHISGHMFFNFSLYTRKARGGPFDPPPQTDEVSITTEVRSDKIRRDTSTCIHRSGNDNLGRLSPVRKIPVPPSPLGPHEVSITNALDWYRGTESALTQ